MYLPLRKRLSQLSLLCLLLGMALSSLAQVTTAPTAIETEVLQALEKLPLADFTDIPSMQQFMTASQAILSKGKPAIDVLNKLILDVNANSQQRIRALRVIQAFGGGDIELLLKLTQDPNPLLRAEAAKLLIHQTHPKLTEIFNTLLSDTAPEVRAAAIIYLGGIKDERVHQLAVNALSDDNPRLRLAGILALSHFKDARLLNHFSQHLQGMTAFERDQAYMALVSVHSPELLDLYIQALNEPGVEARLTAANGLGYIHDARSIAPLSQALRDDTEQVRTLAAKSLLRLRSLPVLPSLLPLQQDPDSDTRALVTSLLERLHDPTVIPSLESALRDEDPLVQQIAADALINTYQDPAAVKKWISELKAAGKEITPDQCELLAQLGPDEVDLLLPFLNNPDMRANIATMLGSSTSTKAITALSRYVHDKDEAVSEFSTRSIVEIKLNQIIAMGHDPKAIEQLVQIAHDLTRSISERMTALNALEALNYPQLAQLIISLLAEQGQMENAKKLVPAARLVDDPKLIPLLMAIDAAEHTKNAHDATTDPYSNQQIHAATVLGSLREPKAMAIVLNACEPFPYIDNSEIKEPRGCPPGIRLALGYGPPMIDIAVQTVKTAGTAAARESALHFLMWAGGPQTIDLLLALLRDTAPGKRLLAATTFAQFIDAHGAASCATTVPALCAALQDSNAKVRNAVISTLGQSHDTRAIPALLALVDNTSLRRAVIKALGDIGADPDGEVCKKFIPFLQLEDTEMQQTVAQALGTLNNPDAKEALYQAWQHELQQHPAAENMGDIHEKSLSILLLAALAQLGDQRAVEPLIARLSLYYNFEPEDLSIDPGLKALITMPGAEVTQRLLDLLQQDQFNEKKMLLAILAARKDAAAIEPLLTLLRKPNMVSQFSMDMGDQQLILTTLAHFSDPRVTNALVEALNDGILATDAAVALSSQMDTRGVPVLVREINYAGYMLMSDEGFADKWVSALADINDPRALDTLINIAGSYGARTSIRWHAVIGLGAIKDPKAIDPLISVLKDDDVTLLAIAGKALEQITGESLGCHYGRWKAWRKLHK